MESLQNLQSRSKAVKNVGQITKAMEVVSATKMRRAQEVALRSRSYAYAALILLKKIAGHEELQTFFSSPRPLRRTLLVIVASDKGLAGSFNAQVFRAADEFLKNDAVVAPFSHAYRAIAIGKKAAHYITRKRLDGIAEYHGFGDYVHLKQIDTLTHRIVRGFTECEFDRVVAISTHFRTALRQDALVRQILPIHAERIHDTIEEIIPEHGRYAEMRNAMPKLSNGGNGDYIFEPSHEAIREELLPHLVRMQMYHLILEANASEHSARRVAMKTASDNADELLESLTLTYNKARQASITKELIEITSTQNALT